jgi:hypothetical protein
MVNKGRPFQMLVARTDSLSHVHVYTNVKMHVGARVPRQHGVNESDPATKDAIVRALAGSSCLFASCHALACSR